MNLDERITELGFVSEAPRELIKQLIKEVVEYVKPEEKDPRLVDAGNPLYQRENLTPAENFRMGFTVGQGVALAQIETKAKELGL